MLVGVASGSGGLGVARRRVIIADQAARNLDRYWSRNEVEETWIDQPVAASSIGRNCV